MHHADELSKILSSTSGTGLSEIWTHMTHREVRAQDFEKIQQLDGVAQRLPPAMQGKSIAVMS